MIISLTKYLPAKNDDKDSLQFWPDLDGKFVDFPKINKFVVNKSIDAKDADGNPVHPRDFEKVFAKGTWVDIDFFCCL